MTVCFFGIYNPEYSRNVILSRGLQANNIKVIYCHSGSKGLRRFFDLINLHNKIKKDYDVLFVAFPGYQVMLLAKLLTKKSIVFDAFNSIYDSTVIDREKVDKYSFKAFYYWILNWLACKLADKILLDTEEHINYFVKEFHLRRERFVRIFIGADDKVFYPQKEERKESDYFLVHFHGSFIPLQGIQFILQAAKILEKEKIKFNIIGKGQKFKEMKNFADKLKLQNVNFTGFLTTKEIAKYQTNADVCLGIFGHTPKASRIIPNKVYEAMAMGKAVITGESPATRELLKDKENVLFCKMADAKDLADKILILKNNQKLRDKIAENSYQLFKNELTPIVLGKQLTIVINQLKFHGFRRSKKNI